MDIIVQKYGGSSLAEDDQLRAVARRVADCRRAGNAVVVVVSARGDTTSELLSHAGRLNANPEHRELDMLLAAGEQQSASMLSLALHDLDLDAVAFTGPQAGVRTCDSHLNARISRVEPERMQRHLDEGQICVVAGFQGASPEGDITTLGRGGSDTTAVAIAAALGAKRCEIYSDVDGVYTADPRVVEDATRLRVLGQAEMKTMAHHGAGVLNERAIDYAIKHGVTIYARKAHGTGGETVVRADSGAGRSRIVGVACHKELLRVDFSEDCDREGLLERLAELDLFVPELADAAPGTCLIPAGQVADARGLAAALEDEFGADLTISGPLASVSAIGFRAGRDPGTVVFAENALADNGIAVHESFSFEHAVTCLVDADAMASALEIFHSGFRITDTGVAHVA